MLKIQDQPADDYHVVALTGSLETQNVPELQHHLHQVLKKQVTVILDLSGLEYITSAGAALFVEIGGLARKIGRSLRLAAPQHHVRETLSILHLDSSEVLFAIYPTLEEAIKG